MKKILALLIIVFATAANAQTPQTWHTANQSTVAWDAVETNENGDPVLPAEISYVVYLCNAVTDINCTNPAEVASTTETQQLITINTEGKYFVGVKAVRAVDGEIVGESVIAWSNDLAYNWGLQYYAAPAVPSGLRLP